MAKNPLELSKAIKESEYPKARYQSKDYGNIRIYPTPSRMDKNNKWLGDYYSIEDAFGFDDKSPRMLVETDKDYDVYQLPDSYYSINPKITGYSFKTLDDLFDYQDWESKEMAKGDKGQPFFENYIDYRKKQDNSKRLLDDYYNSKIDLDTLHDQLVKVHGNIKPAFEWLLKNARK